MTDVVLRLGLDQPGDDRALDRAISTYAQWRAYLCDVEARIDDADAPDIMVKSAMSPSGSIEKLLIFQDRRWAAGFLRIWRNHRRAGH